MMWKYVFLEFIDDINSCLLSHLSQGKAAVTNNLKTLEACNISGIILTPKAVVHCGYALYSGIVEGIAPILVHVFFYAKRKSKKVEMHMMAFI